jgi:hypothetical protein
MEKMALVEVDTSEELVEPESETADMLLNAVAAALCTMSVQFCEDRIHQHPEFFSARRVPESNAYRVVVMTQYAAGPSMGTMTLSCWVHDEESKSIPGVNRVSDLKEDPRLAYA